MVNVTKSPDFDINHNMNSQREGTNSHYSQIVNIAGNSGNTFNINSHLYALSHLNSRQSLHFDPVISPRVAL